MAQQLSPAAIIALKEALCSIYWYKRNLREFLQLCLSTPAILNNFNWENYKHQIASDVIDFLVANPSKYIADLTKICNEICKMTDFSHLNQIDDSSQKAKKAKDAVTQLKKFVEPHQDEKKEQEKVKKRQEQAANKLKENKAVREKLEVIKNEYMTLVSSSNAQGRGFELEKSCMSYFIYLTLTPKPHLKIWVSRLMEHFHLKEPSIFLKLNGKKNLSIKLI